MTEHSTTCGCFLPKVQQMFNAFIHNNPIYPLDPIAPENSEFFLIDSKIRIRVIHIAPENGKRFTHSVVNYEPSFNKRSSLSEDYWFTKWNKPKVGNICNCSFRRSQRLSVLSHSSSNKNQRHEAARQSLNLIPTRITNVESFVERIIEETIFEAFQEYYMIQNGGTVNQGYQKSDDEDSGVVLREKKRSSKRVSRHCLHKIQPKKPFVILFHGIGNSADVWMHVIKSLVNKGFEIIAPDLLGHGFSSAPDKASAYTFHNLLIHAITIFDHYVEAADAKRKCILIGHSYGCSLVSALYRHRASQISQLILISGGGPTPLAAPVKNSEISPFGCIHTLFKPLLFCGVKRSFLFASRGKHFDSCDTDNFMPKHILEYVSRGQKWPEGDAAFHRRILVPTLLVHGLQDKKVTLVQQCEMERTIPRAFLELIPNAGHAAMLETPEHLSHMILCFIDTWS